MRTAASVPVRRSILKAALFRFLTFRKRDLDGRETTANRGNSLAGWRFNAGAAVLAACPGPAAYELRYELATMPASLLADMLAGNRHFRMDPRFG